MAQYTVTAFRWSGTGYNAQYNTSYTAVITDDDAFLNGNGDSNETVSIDGGPSYVTNGAPYDINVSFTDTSGTPHVETFYFFNVNNSWYFIPGPGSAFTEGATLGSYQSHTTAPTLYSTITCFVRGTLIETQNGLMPVEMLRPGTMVRTSDGRFKPLRLPMSRKIRPAELRANPKLAPVRIVAGALGNGLPKRDLLVSRQHRMLVSSKICERMFGQTDVLLAAHQLTVLPGIFEDNTQEDVEYFHLVFDRHEVIFAEGAPTESFFPGPEAIKAMPAEARAEILAIFPQIQTWGFVPEPAFQIPPGKLQRKLVARHLKNNRPLL
ncbi:MAG: hypothetical protein EpisKO_05350 [Epibacterium sp.]